MITINRCDIIRSSDTRRKREIQMMARGKAMPMTPYDKLWLGGRQTQVEEFNSEHQLSMMTYLENPTFYDENI